MRIFSLLSAILILGGCYNQLVHTADSNGDQSIDGLYLTSIDTLNVNTLVPMRNGSQISFSVSPSRQFAAFMYDLDTPGVDELYIVDLFSPTAPRKLSRPLGAGGDVNGFWWSPVDDAIAYRADAFINGQDELFVVYPSGSPHRRLTRPTDGFTSIGSVHFAPTIRYLAFHGRKPDASGGSSTALYTVRYASTAPPIRVVSPQPLGPNSRARFMSWAPSSRALAFEFSESGGTRQFYTAAFDGHLMFNLTNTLPAGHAIGGFRWAPFPHRFAYISHLPTGPSDLYVSRSRSTSPTLVATNVFSDQIDWAPDGSRLAFSRFTHSGSAGDDGAYGEVFTVLPDGAGEVRVSGPFDVRLNLDEQFYWAPDSSRLAFVVDGDISTGDHNDQLYSVMPSGSFLAQLSGPLPVGRVSDLKWSPDGAMIIYGVTLNDTGGKDLWTVAGNDGSTRIRVSRPPGATSHPRRVFRYEWSPDCGFISYMVQKADFSTETYTLEPDGANRVTLDNPASTGFFSIGAYRWR